MGSTAYLAVRMAYAQLLSHPAHLVLELLLLIIPRHWTAACCCCCVLQVRPLDPDEFGEGGPRPRRPRGR